LRAHDNRLSSITSPDNINPRDESVKELHYKNRFIIGHQEG